MTDAGLRVGRYSTFDDAGEDILRLSFVPRTVTAEGRALAPGGEGPGYSFEPKVLVLRVRRSAARTVTVTR